MRLHLPFDLVIEIRRCKYDADTDFNYIDISLSRYFPISFSVGGEIIATKNTKLVQVFNIGFRYTKNKILVRF